MTKVVAFGAAVEIPSESFEEHDPIWTPKAGEDCPWRFQIRPEVMADEERWVPAEELREQLEF
ncbi:MAG: hypothetical protein GEU81_03950 [Nitriliruptorales bacterium]|nr:hypothetical protein [Nitriliruptorales bacterium]